jgi:TetR/AcrR family transcriptional repressor of nem operon
MNLKEHIIEESLRLFTLKGFAGTSMNDILCASNTSKGGFYNHFSSKKDLFLHVLALARTHWREKNLAGLDNLSDPVDRLQRMLRNYRDRYLRDTRHLPGGCFFVMLSVELADQDPDLARELERGFAGLRSMIHRHVETACRHGLLVADVAPEDVSAILFNGMLGAALVFGADKSTRRLNRSIDSLVQYLDRLRSTSVQPFSKGKPS